MCRSLAVILLFTVACSYDRLPTAPRSPGADSDRVTDPTYEAIDLGGFGGGFTLPLDVNDSGVVVGTSSRSDGLSIAFRWDDGIITDLNPAESFGSSRADALNAGGLVAGLGQPDGEARNIVAWIDGEMRTISPSVPSYGGGRAIAVTPAGDVLAQLWSDHSDIDSRSGFWRGGSWQDLGSLRGSGVLAWAMNGPGQVVGTNWMGSLDSRDYFHAFHWDNGAMRDLGALGVALCPDTEDRSCFNADAFDINAIGDVVGMSTDSAGPFFPTYPVRWRNGVVERLADFEGRAIAINDRGQVAIVATAFFVADGTSFIWENGSLTDLGSLGGGGTVIRAMNEQGIVVGESRTATGETHAFRWADGVMTDLGVGPSGAPHSIALKVNEGGEIIGQAGTCAPDGHGRCGFSDGASGVLWRPRPPSQVVATVAIAPGSVTTGMFETRQMMATAHDPNGQPVARPLAFTWTSSDPGAVSVSVDPTNPSRATVKRLRPMRGVTVTATAEGTAGNALVTWR
jgi:probable HAF family extracellular repeat protein